MTTPGWAHLVARTDAESRAVVTILGQEWARGKALRYIDDGAGIDFHGMLSRVDDDDECAGCGHVFTSHTAPRWDDVRCIVTRCGCDGFELEHPGPYWSSSERALIELAANLWNAGNGPVNLADLIDRCGDASLALALDAIAARAGGQLPGWVRA